uniref:Putative secreted protein n=1 Tax=Ixodes ricinus TaxID=34613 RepID=A0A147BF21_IXORI
MSSYFFFRSIWTFLGSCFLRCANSCRISEALMLRLSDPLLAPFASEVVVVVAAVAIVEAPPLASVGTRGGSTGLACGSFGGSGLGFGSSGLTTSVLTTSVLVTSVLTASGRVSFGVGVSSLVSGTSGSVSSGGGEDGRAGALSSPPSGSSCRCTTKLDRVVVGCVTFSLSSSDRLCLLRTGVGASAKTASSSACLSSASRSPAVAGLRAGFLSCTTLAWLPVTAILWSRYHFSASRLTTSRFVSLGTFLMRSTICRCVSEVMLTPLTSTMRSPSRSPAYSAGLPSSILPTYWPSLSFSACRLKPYPSKSSHFFIWHSRGAGASGGSSTVSDSFRITSPLAAVVSSWWWPLGCGTPSAGVRM